MRARVLVCALVLGCSSGSPVEESRDAGDAGDAAETGTSWGASACGTCVATACTAAFKACSADPSCAGYASCLRACPVTAAGNADPACEAACPKPTGSTGTAAKSDLDACRASAACPACGGPPSVLDQVCAPSAQTNPCYKCEAEHCCNTSAACKGNAECTALLKCMQECPSAGYEACRDKCIEDHPTGLSDLARKLTCVTIYCNTKALCNVVDPSSCEVCQETSCRASFVACQADADCYKLWNCATPCGADAACINACKAKSSAAAGKLFDGHILCASDKCKAECG